MEDLNYRIARKHVNIQRNDRLNMLYRRTVCVLSVM